MAKETLGLANLQFRAKYPSFRFTPSFNSRITFPLACVRTVENSSPRHVTYAVSFSSMAIYFFCTITMDLVQSSKELCF